MAVQDAVLAGFGATGTIQLIVLGGFGEGAGAPAQAPASSATPGYDWLSPKKRKKKKAKPVEEVLYEPPETVPPDRDAPLREFIARQEARSESRKAGPPEPPPFDPRPMLEAAQRIESERRRRNRARILLLLTE